MTQWMPEVAVSRIKENPRLDELLTIFLLFIELCPGEFHIKRDNQGTSDIIVVKVWQTFTFLPHPSSRLGDFIPHNVDLLRKTHEIILNLKHHHL